MNVKRRAYILAVTAAASLAAVVLLLLLGARQPEQPADPSSALPRYTIGEYDGRLAVYTDQQELPQQIYDVYLSTLPEEEQFRIRNGIQVEDELELQQLLEDYTS